MSRRSWARGFGRARSLSSPTFRAPATARSCVGLRAAWFSENRSATSRLSKIQARWKACAPSPTAQERDPESDHESRTHDRLASQLHEAEARDARWRHPEDDVRQARGSEFDRPRDPHGTDPYLARH